MLVYISMDHALRLTSEPQLWFRSTVWSPMDPSSSNSLWRILFYLMPLGIPTTSTHCFCLDKSPFLPPSDFSAIPPIVAVGRVLRQPQACRPPSPQQLRASPLSCTSYLQKITMATTAPTMLPPSTRSTPHPAFSACSRSSPSFSCAV